METIYSAPLSVILAGEYSYSYGKPLLLCGVKDRITTRLGKREDMIADQAWIAVQNEITHYLEGKRILLEKIKSPAHINRTSQVLFSSEYADLISFIGAFLSQITKKPVSLETVNEIAYFIRKKQNNILADAGSSVTTYGGLIFYRKEFDFLKYISQMNINIPEIIEKDLFIIPLAKNSFSSEKINSLFGLFYNKKPKDAERFLNDSEKATKRIVVSMIKEDGAFLKIALNDIQISAEQMNFFPKNVSEVCEKIRAIGGGAKIIYDTLEKDQNAFILTSLEESKLKNIRFGNGISFLPFRQSKHGLIADRW